MVTEIEKEKGKKIWDDGTLYLPFLKEAFFPSEVYRTRPRYYLMFKNQK